MRYYLVGFDKDGDPVVIFYDVQHFENDGIGDFDAISFKEDGVDYTYTALNGQNYEEIDKKAPDFFSYKLLDENEAQPYLAHFGGHTTNAQAQAAKKTKKKTSKKSSGIQGAINVNQGTAKIKLSTGKEVDILDPNVMSTLTPAEAKELEKLLKKQLGKIFNIGDVEIEVDYSKDKTNPTITFPDGQEFTLEELMNMGSDELEELGEDNDVDIAEVISEINAQIFRGTTGKTKVVVGQIFGGTGGGSSSSSSGCGSGYSGGSSCGGGSSYGGGCGGGSYRGC